MQQLGEWCIVPVKDIWVGHQEYLLYLGIGKHSFSYSLSGLAGFLGSFFFFSWEEFYSDVGWGYTHLNASLEMEYCSRGGLVIWLARWC